MASNFFELVNDGFFNPFANKNKRYNYDLLQLINNKMSLDNLQVSKETIVDWITDYIDNCPIELFDDETESYEGDVKTFAYDKVRYFVKCGWLVEDFEGVGITYQMDENGIKLLSAMENAVKDDSKSLEFSGFVYNIYNNLYYFKIDHSVQIIEQAYETSKQLNSMLRGLNVNIKKFLAKLIRENEAMPKEILQTIFFDYQKKVVLKAFKNFREKDNPSKYKLAIENKINSLLEDEMMDAMISNYITVKCENSNTVENIAEARDFFVTRLNYIRDQFDEIEENISVLDRRNTKYVSTAQSRLNFLLNEETDIEGRIIECLKAIGNADEEFFEEPYFDLFSGVNIDEYSLSKPGTKKNKPKPEPLIDDFEPTQEELKEYANKLFKENEYSVYNINKYIINKLGNKILIHSKDIKINDFSDFLKLFLAQVYSENTSIEYKITFLDDSYRIFGYKMNDFIIERK